MILPLPSLASNINLHDKNNNILWDPILIQYDTYILGTIFPKGQVSLYLDQDQNYGVNTELGHIYSELFQFFYFTYYFNLFLYLLVFIFLTNFFLPVV